MTSPEKAEAPAAKKPGPFDNVSGFAAEPAAAPKATSPKKPGPLTMWGFLPPEPPATFFTYKASVRRSLGHLTMLWLSSS